MSLYYTGGADAHGRMWTTYGARAEHADRLWPRSIIRLATCRNLLLPHNLMRHAINVVLRHVEASRRIYLVCHNRSGGTSYGGLSCHKWSPGLTMAAIIGPQRGGLTVAGADQLWQPQSVRGDHLWHERLP